MISARTRRLALGVLATFALLAGLLTVNPAPSTASTNGVYVVAPKWWGWCPDIRGLKNVVVAVSVTNTTTGHSMSDLGDDIGWSNVALNRSNTLHVNVGCSRGHGSTGTVVTIRPTRHKQTFWVSPGGSSYGN